MQALDMWTNDFASIGSRTFGTEAGNFMITGPNWTGETPAGVKETFKCPTRFAWILVQISCSNPEEYPEIHALQDGLILTPLSFWGKPYTPPTNVTVNPDVDTTATPFDQLRLMDGVTFFKRLAIAMKDNPATGADDKMVKMLHKLGVEPGKELDPSTLSPAVIKGMNKAALEIFSLLGTAQYEMKAVNGWILALNMGKYKDDYNTRAFIAYAGLGALTSDDAVYPSAFVDGDGNVLNAANNYRMHFEKDGLFPSQSGVWSISAYRENFYVRNPIERYGILSSMPLKYNADGTLDIYIQAKSPGAEKEVNWLPIPPSGPFNISIRVYQPKKEIMDGRTENNVVVEASTYVIPAIMKVD
jgi:hypothetical protein